MLYVTNDQRLSSSMASSMLLQQSIPIINKVRMLAHSSADDPHIATWLASENLCDVSVEHVSYPCHLPYYNKAVHAVGACATIKLA